jgi:predicted PurR-regulated permease PerM
MNNFSGQYFFMGLLLAVAILAIIIFLPFLTPLVFAVSLAVIFGPFYRSLLHYMFPKKEKSSIVAWITLLLVVLIVIVPGFLIVNKMYAEIQNMYYFLTEEGSRSVVINSLNRASDFVSSALFNIYPSASFDSFNVTNYIQQGLEWAFSHVDTLFTGVGKIAMGIFITFFALFYFLRDGREFKKQIIALSPLKDMDDERIFTKLEQAVYSIVGGSLVVSVIQGILTGIGFAIFQVPQPTVWGSIAAVAALIPGVGTALVVVPGVLYLFFTGSTGYAIGLLIWGLLAVGLIDNLLGPLVVNRGIKIHPFIILLSVLGGLTFFGLVGFILGPLIIAFLFALLEIYKNSKATL